MMRKAISVYERMMELCTNDNLGARYCLMHLHAFMEEEGQTLKLFNQYKSNDSQSAFSLLPPSKVFDRENSRLEAIIRPLRSRRVMRQ